MKALMLLILTLYSLVVFAEIHNGVYEQQPMASVKNISDPELKKKYFERFNNDKITLTIKDKELVISMHNGQDSAALPMKIYGDTIVAHDENLYYILYQENKDTLHSTGTIFKRVNNANP